MGNDCAKKSAGVCVQMVKKVECICLGMTKRGVVIVMRKKKVTLRLCKWPKRLNVFVQE